MVNSTSAHVSLNRQLWLSYADLEFGGYRGYLLDYNLHWKQSNLAGFSSDWNLKVNPCFHGPLTNRVRSNARKIQNFKNTIWQTIYIIKGFLYDILHEILTWKDNDNFTYFCTDLIAALACLKMYDFTHFDGCFWTQIVKLTNVVCNAWLRLWLSTWADRCKAAACSKQLNLVGLQRRGWWWIFMKHFKAASRYFYKLKCFTESEKSYKI